MGSAESFINAPFNLAAVYLGLSTLMLFGDYFRPQCLGGRVLMNVYCKENCLQQTGPMFDEFLYLQASGLLGLTLLAGFSGQEEYDNGATNFLQNVALMYFIVFLLASALINRNLRTILRDCGNPFCDFFGNWPCSSRECVFKFAGGFGLCIMNALFSVWMAMYAFMEEGSGDTENKVMFGLILACFAYVLIDFMLNLFSGDNFAACCDCQDCCGEAGATTNKPGVTGGPPAKGNAAYSPVAEQPQPPMYGNQYGNPPANQYDQYGNQMGQPQMAQPVVYGQPNYPQQPYTGGVQML